MMWWVINYYFIPQERWLKLQLPFEPQSTRTHIFNHYCEMNERILKLRNEDECGHHCKMKKGTLKLKTEDEYFSPHGVLF